MESESTSISKKQDLLEVYKCYILCSKDSYKITQEYKLCHHIHFWEGLLLLSAYPLGF